ncbi:MAG: hypothetical protein LBQ21_07490 [Clostridiales Family XIII bacterium]|jgi:septal ring factor EnvC (AmiA/AmiB activator)|nr:hypothetical protein [Clostridiales Family XIII bacterium]
MSKETKTPATEGTKTPETEGMKQFEAITTQEEFDRMVSERVMRERDKYKGFSEYKEAAEKLAKLEASQRSDLEKLQDANAELAAKVAAFESREQVAAWMQEIAEKTGVSAKALRGTTKEELEAHAETLKEVYSSSRISKPPAPVVPGLGEHKGGASATTAQQFAEAIGDML